MKKITAWLSTGFSCCDIRETVEVEDGMTDDEIEKIAREALFDCIDWGWYEEGGELEHEEAE